MPPESINLKCLIRVLDEDVHLCEALALPEVSSLEDGSRPGHATLATKAKTLLEDTTLVPAISLHRRRIGVPVEIDSIEVTFVPPKRSAEWETPVTLTIHFARWTEEGRLQAYVPVLGAHVFANRPAQLRQHVEEHVRLILASVSQPPNLARLAELARVRSIHSESLEVSIHRKSPRQEAAAAEGEADRSAILEQLAEELPPIQSATAPAQARPPKTSTAAAEIAHELEDDLQRFVDATSGAHRRSILIVGPPGSGKSALVRELARRRADLGFAHTAFWTTTAARLMSGPVGFGMWQERCQQLCREIARTRAVLHLGNLAELIEVGKVSRDGQSVGGFLRSWIARGEIFAIAEATPDQLAVIDRQEPNLLASFQLWNILERSPAQVRRILERVVEAAPGKATGKPAETTLALDRIHQLHSRYATYSANPGRPLRFLRNLLADQFPEKSLSESAVLNAFSRETGLPTVLLDDDVPLDLDETKAWFSHRVVGQPAAVDRVLNLLAMVKARLSRPRKPLASFLFIGPTGTGKTEMAKATAKFLFGDVTRMVRFDLNEFADPIAVQRLIGGPATGGTEGLLTARVREQPFSVILLDEFEKADPSFFDLLLQLLGDGRLTDASGRVADFCNSVVIMTSNLGAQGFHTGPVGFRTGGTRRDSAGEHFSDAVRRFLRPEIFNRIDAVVPFLPLDETVVLQIATRHLEEIRLRDGLRFRPVNLRIEPEVARHLAAEGYDIRYGARPLRRTIARQLLVPLADGLNSHPCNTPLAAVVGWKDGRPDVLVRPAIHEPTPASVPDPQATTPQSLADRSVLLRRKINRLAGSFAGSQIDDEFHLLEAAERRRGSTRQPTPENRARLERLRACRTSCDQLVGAIEQLEDELLLPLYQRLPVDPTPFIIRLAAIEADRQRVVHDLFQTHLPNPNGIVMAFFAEPRELLSAFAGTYHRIASRLGTVEAIDFFTASNTARKTGLRLVRKPQPNPQLWPDPLPDDVWGVALRLSGDLSFPRFTAEDGLHCFREGRREQVAWIQTHTHDLDTLKVPERIEQPGRVKASAGATRRTFVTSQHIVRDLHLGERNCPATEWQAALATLIEERLEGQMRTITGQEPS